MTDALRPRDAKDVQDAVALGAVRGQDARSRGPRLQARARPPEPVRPDARSLRPQRRHALRAGGAGALRQGRHAARRDRGACRAEQPAARVRADGLRPASRRRAGCGLARRRARRQSLRPAPHQVGRRARSFPRRVRHLRAWRDLQVRRPRGEERHRLRSLQGAGRLVRHARRDDRRDDQDAAEAGDRGKRRRRRARRHARQRSDVGRDGVVLRRFGGRASAARRW